MDDEKLINLIQNRKELYDKSNPFYKLAGRKRMLWEQIAKELNTTAEVCMRRWTALRDRYAREIRKFKAPSGSAFQYQRPWYLLETLQFLKPHVLPRPIRCSTNICPVASETSPLPLSPTTVPLPSPSPPTFVQLPSPSPPTTASLQSLSPPTFAQLPSPSTPTMVSLPSPSPPIFTQLPAPSPPVIVPLLPLSLSVIDITTSPPLSPTPALSDRARGTKRRNNTDVDKAMIEAIEVFQNRCRAREDQSSNPTINSFGTMMVSILSKMSAAKQTRAMQKIMEVAFQVQQEPE